MIRTSLILSFVVCLCFSLIVPISFGQDAGRRIETGATLRGHIVDISPQQNPIEGVRVEIENTNGEIFTVYTDKEGFYEKTGLAKGRYSISTYKKGYGSRTGKSKVVSSGGEGYDRIKMRKTETLITFLFKQVFTWQLIVGFAMGFLAALLLNSLHTRSEAR
ncbi:carboxypeptidase regulatory-like domain-containing protein [Candidatus Poribacteria bacterium]|nr:carboxypeptidase regulatory-like domain-containing protein [Candidatus Poribacteria bacterium]